MKRKLLTQMRHELPGNIWLVVELAIISVILWLACSQLYMIVKIYQPDEHYDISKDYILTVKKVPADGEEEPDDQRMAGDYAVLLNRLRNMPHVKAVGGTSNGIPYEFNYFGNSFYDVIDGDTIVYNGNQRYYDSEAIKIMGLTGTRGETPEQIAAELEKGNIIISTIEYMEGFEDNGSPAPRIDAERLRGHLLNCSYGGTFQTSMIQIRPVRRADYEPTHNNGTILRHLDGIASELLVRVEPGKEKEFEDMVKSKPLREGTIVFADLTTVAERREKSNVQVNIATFNSAMQSGFFLLLAFLGILGTYWFRVQERIPEVAIRKVNGATKLDILRRLFGESMILLAVATALALAAEWLLLDKELISETIMQMHRHWLYASMAITTCALSVIVLAAIYIPARKAMKTDPAVALKDQ